MAEQPAGLAFHAAPPAGHWLNDPNGLAHADGAYRLFAQHAGPGDHRAIGWARFSSADLLRWTFDGPVIPPEGGELAYSGSLSREGAALAAWHTAHRGGMQRQVRRISRDAGASWSAAGECPALGEAARNRRDPFVFEDRGGRALLLAETCDWQEWEGQPPSRLALHRSNSGGDWRLAGRIGPWRPPGVMWEVPVLLRIGGHDVLILSEVDRRGGGAACSVRGWIGALGDDGFHPRADAPPEGLPLDIGPDFYALCPSLAAGWPGAPVVLGWAASWATARTLAWPGFAGGPISLPRALTLARRPEGLRLAVNPAAGVEAHFTPCAEPVGGAGRADAVLPDGAPPATLRVENATSALMVTLDRAGGRLAARRDGPGGLAWSADAPWRPGAGEAALTLFIDGPLVEVFAGGTSLTAAIDLAGGVPAVTLEAGSGRGTLEWSRLGA